MDVKARAVIRPSSSDLWFLSYLPLAVSDGIATPLVPLLALARFSATPFVVVVIIAASSLSQVPFTILWGNLSDRIAHRKYFLVGSFGASGACIVAMAFATNLGSYFWLNVLEGLASAASAPIGTMLLLETRQKRWWPTDMGLFGFISGIGTTAGLGLGFLWLFVFGLSWPVVQVMTGLLVLSGVLALLGALLAWGWIEEPGRQYDRRSLADLVNGNRGLLERMRHVRTWVLNIVELTRSRAEPLPARELLFLVALGVMSVGFFLFYGPFPVFLIQRAGLSNAAVFVAYLGSSAASTALFYHSGKAVEVHSPKYIFLESLGGRVVLMLLFVPGPLFLAFGLGSVGLLGYLTLLNTLLGVTWAFISTASTLFLVRLVGRSGRGRALGLYNAVSGAGALAGTVLGGLLYVSWGVHTEFLVAAIVVTAGAALLLPIPYHVFSLGRPVAHLHPRLQRSVRASSAPPRLASEQDGAAPGR
ncbi:MAG: MFS transporter [Thermoplasmata archaeon]|nr:MFS transporter [Thermoplasmata archaeon]MCI4341549.1 MFS transporter [Thermoplasmata archaeon]